MMKKTRSIATILLALFAAQVHAADTVVSSPNGRVVLRVVEDGGSFSISRGGEAVIATSPLGLELDGQPAFGALTMESREDVAEDRVIPLVATKAATARDHYRGATLTFRETGGNRRLFIDVRAYDDGVAFRYRLASTAPVSLRGERTAFIPAGDPSCLVSEAAGAHEVNFQRLRSSQLRTDAGYDVPFVCATPSGRTHYAITQANLAGYTGASLWREGAALRVRLSAVPGRPGPAFTSAGGLTTAWRAVMMADRSGQLIESQLVGNLNPAPDVAQYGDFSWVKPGKAAWDWRIGGVVDPGRLDVVERQAGVFERAHQQVLHVPAAADGDLLALQIGHGLQRRVLRHEDGDALRIRLLGREVDRANAGRLCEDAGRVGGVAEIDGAGVQRLQQHRAGGELGPLHVPAQRLERGLELACALEDVERVELLVSDAQRAAVSGTRRRKGGGQGEAQGVAAGEVEAHAASCALELVLVLEDPDSRTWRPACFSSSREPAPKSLWR